MTPPPETFAIGAHRPIYLWAGPGTVRMNRLKFMDAPVDEAIHHEAHTATGALRVAQEAQCTWAYLMYDWGFPPEVAQADWADFARAVQVYHVADVRIFGYVQTSNCVFAGSHRDKDWYARDPRGRRIYYYTGRYMTCWQHPAWRERLRKMIRGILQAGADGVFFDNPWYGAQPLHLGGTWIGPAGCYCERCRAAFRSAADAEIPTEIRPDDPLSRRYLRWRAEQVTATLRKLAAYARDLQPDAAISANDFDAVMRPSKLIYGIDLASLAEVQDVMMIEDYGLPRWERPTLLNNALTIRTARALIGDTPLSVDPYDKGIGFDQVYAPRRFQQGIAETAACGATMVVKGTEYVAADGAFTLLTAAPYAPQREAIGAIHRWLEEHADLYNGEDRRSIARVGLLFPADDALWFDWDRLAPGYFGAGLTLLAAGIPWRVVTSEDDVCDLGILLRFDDTTSTATPPDGLRVIDVPSLPGWAAPTSSTDRMMQRRSLRALATRAIDWLYRAYFRRRWARALGDRLNLAHFFAQSPRYELPSPTTRRALLDALGDPPHPHVIAPAPVLAAAWRQGDTGRQQLHLVNYAAEPQTVTVVFARPTKGKRIAFGAPPTSFESEGAKLKLTVDLYSVLTYA